MDEGWKERLWGDRGQRPFFLIAGPCVLEGEKTVLQVAHFLRGLSDALNIPIIFKSSYDKANRTSLSSFRGPGLREGLPLLAKVREQTGLPVLSDVHRLAEVEEASAVLDLLQIPAFLCRQTDLIVKAAETGLPLNIKKAQFLSPWDMRHPLEKASVTGNRHLLVTERGTCFGYNNLVVDMRAVPILKGFGFPVVFDATHSVQLPGGAGTSSGGERRYVEPLARAAVAAGADGVFLEIHPDPETALCDGPNSLPLEQVEGLLRALIALHGLTRHGG